jgi:predicted nucleic acid binding AN1-type Zn finger protein
VNISSKAFKYIKGDETIKLSSNLHTHESNSAFKAIMSHRQIEIFIQSHMQQLQLTNTNMHAS